MAQIFFWIHKKFVLKKSEQTEIIAIFPCCGSEKKKVAKMGNSASTPHSEIPTLYERQTFPRQEKKPIAVKAHTIDRRMHNDSNNNNSDGHNNPESSRMLFLMYLIHRTWNIVSDGKGKR